MDEQHELEMSCFTEKQLLETVNLPFERGCRRHWRLKMVFQEDATLVNVELIDMNIWQNFTVQFEVREVCVCLVFSLSARALALKLPPYLRTL